MVKLGNQSDLKMVETQGLPGYTILYTPHIQLTPEHWWLGDDPFLLGFGPFLGAMFVSGKVSLKLLHHYSRTLPKKTRSGEQTECNQQICHVKMYISMFHVRSPKANTNKTKELFRFTFHFQLS